MSSSRRRKRAEPRVQPAPIPAPVDDTQPRTTTTTTTARCGLVTHLLIAVCRDGALAADAVRIPDPPLAPVSPVDVATAVATRLHAQLPQRVPRSNIKTPLPVAAVEALVAQVATDALAALAAGWTRAVAEEAVRHEAATARHTHEAGVAGQWNLRSRPVGLLGSPSLGFGQHVLPYLRRSVEGRALHATSQEIRGACRRANTRWAVEVLRGMVHVAFVVCTFRHLTCFSLVLFLPF